MRVKGIRPASNRADTVMDRFIFMAQYLYEYRFNYCHFAARIT